MQTRRCVTAASSVRSVIPLYSWRIPTSRSPTKRERTTMRGMAMGKRKRDRQSAMWVTTTDLPTAASHPFYRRLNQVLREHGFDDFPETQCTSFYAETMGRPRLPPGIYFRQLLIGYFA